SDWAEEGANQARECAGFGHFAAGSTVRAGQFFKLRGAAVLVFERFDEVVVAVPVIARGTFAQRVNERLDVTGGLPHLAWQDNGRVQSDHIAASSNEGIPPLRFNVFFEFNAKWTVVPCRA